MKNCTERFNWQKPYCRKWFRESCASSAICRMNDSRKIKTLVFGMMDGSNKRGRPQREWSDDIEQWCGATLQELSHAALDRQRWAAIVTMASDTNGHWAHGWRWWRWWLAALTYVYARPIMSLELCKLGSKEPCTWLLCQDAPAIRRLSVILNQQHSLSTAQCKCGLWALCNLTLVIKRTATNWPCHSRQLQWTERWLTFVTIAALHFQVHTPEPV